MALVKKGNLIKGNESKGSIKGEEKEIQRESRTVWVCVCWLRKQI